jgi:hypothetical protein
VASRKPAPSRAAPVAPSAGPSVASSAGLPAATTSTVTRPGSGKADQPADKAGGTVVNSATHTDAGGVPIRALATIAIALLVTAFPVLAAVAVWLRRRTGSVEGGAPEAAPGSAVRELTATGGSPGQGQQPAVDPATTPTAVN